MQLRNYQQRTLDELWDWFINNPEGIPIVDACVGAGKSLMIASVAQRADSLAKGTRVLVLVHQKELLEQNLDKLRRVWPLASMGVYSAALGRKDVTRQVTFATIGSIWKKARELGRIDIVMCDEAHLINSKDAGMWRKFLSDLSRLCPHMRVIGWTGTPFRGNGVWLTAGKEALFTNIATRVTMRELLDMGYLAPLVSAQTDVRVDTSDVKVSGDDFVVSDLAKATDKAELISATCKEIIRLGATRRRWMVFAVTVEHAEHVCDELVRLGVDADVVHSKMSKSERDEIIRDFKAGRLRCLVNVAVLTTGFDCPEVDFIALLRATKSPVLYVQIGGRGMRCAGADITASIANGKADCLWADFTDTTDRMGPIDQIKGRNPTGGGKPGEAPTKLCPECGNQNPTAAPECTTCGFRFPEPERIKHVDHASGTAILSDQAPQSLWKPVTHVNYARHVSRNTGKPSLRVEYCNNLAVIGKEWVCLSHDGFARMKAERWWQERATIDYIPGDVDAALEWINFDPSILKTPVEIFVAKGGEFDNVTGYKWRQDEARSG